MMELTLAGQQAEQIARWAWEDPKARAREGLNRVTALARSTADPVELAQVGDVVAMLSRLAGTVATAPAQLAAEEDDFSLLLSDLAADDEDCTILGQLGALTIGDQIELAAIGGHHIPGTQYTFRHGWIPLVGHFFSDDYAGWHSKGISPNSAKRRQLAREALAKQGVMSAQIRVLTPDQKAMVAAHKAQVARAQRASARALAPTTPPAMRAARKPTAAGMQSQSAMAVGHQTSPPPAKPSSGAAARAAAVFEAHPEATRIAEERADTIAKQSGTVAAARSLVAPDFKPGTVGASLKESDPGLAALAAPGASMAAMKAYIDARVATEVARQMGQITQKQHDELQQKLAVVHKGQQQLAKHVRAVAQENIDQDNHQDRVHLLAYNMFNLASLGVALGGITMGLSPVVAAIATALVPVATTIHDYVRQM